MLYEDKLPPTMTTDEYNAWFAQSEIVDGVRMGPDLDYSDWLQCAMCGKDNAFKISDERPETGYCRFEDIWWTISSTTNGERQ